MNEPGTSLLIAGLIGIVAFLTGIAWGNSVLFRMQKALNEQERPEDRISPWQVIGKGGGKYGTVQKYKKSFGESGLASQDRYSAYLIMIGAVLGFGSLLILKVRN